MRVVTAERVREAPQSGETTMGSLRKPWQVTILVATLMIGALSLGVSRAETGSMGDFLSCPKPNDVIDGSTVEIRLQFKMPVDHGASTLALKSGRDIRPLRPRLESGAKYLTSIVGGLAPGAYELDWMARLSNGQTERGAIPFTVRSSQGVGPSVQVSRAGGASRRSNIIISESRSHSALPIRRSTQRAASRMPTSKGRFAASARHSRRWSPELEHANEAAFAA